MWTWILYALICLFCCCCCCCFVVYSTSLSCSFFICLVLFFICLYLHIFCCIAKPIILCWYLVVLGYLPVLHPKFTTYVQSIYVHLDEWYFSSCSSSQENVPKMTAALLAVSRNVIVPISRHIVLRMCSRHHPRPCALRSSGLPGHEMNNWMDVCCVR